MLNAGRLPRRDESCFTYASFSKAGKTASRGFESTGVKKIWLTSSSTRKEICSVREKGDLGCGSESREMPVHTILTRQRIEEGILQNNQRCKI